MKSEFDDVEIASLSGKTELSQGGQDILISVYISVSNMYQAVQNPYLDGIRSLYLMATYQRIVR